MKPIHATYDPPARVQVQALSNGWVIDDGEFVVPVKTIAIRGDVWTETASRPGHPRVLVCEARELEVDEHGHAAIDARPVDVQIDAANALAEMRA